MSGWVAGATVVSSLVGARASKSAASTQAAAADRAGELQRQQFEQTRADQEPWRQAGVNALGKLEGMADYTMFGPEQFSADPGYGFRLAEGRKALASKARARGGAVSGTSLKAMQDYAQESASNEFSNAFNRYQIERGAKLGPYQTLAGFGQTATNQLGQFGANYASNAGNLMTGGAAAQAAGQVGQANAITGGLGTYLNYSQNNALLNALQRNQNMQLVNTGGFSNTPAYMVNPSSGGD
jgi:hypothetical protein